jgi:hypothetical protein
MGAINLNPTFPQFGAIAAKADLACQLELSLQYYLVSEPS